MQSLRHQKVNISQYHNDQIQQTLVDKVLRYFTEVKQVQTHHKNTSSI